MSLLDALVFGVRYVLDAAGNVMPTRSRIRFFGSVSVADNQLTDTIDVTIGGSSGGGPTIDNSSNGAINAAASTSSGVDAGGIRFTGSTPALAGVDPGSGAARELPIVAYGGPLIVRNDNGGAAASFRIFTGTGADLTLAQGATGLLIRDTNTSRWRLVVGQGSGGSTTPTGTGFAHITGSVMDPGAKKVDLSTTADIMNTLGPNNGGTGHVVADFVGQAGKALVVDVGEATISFAAIPPGTTVPSGSGFRKVVGGAEVSTAATVDLASSTDRTGILPRANQQDQNLAGDTTGTTGASVVAKINGVQIVGGAPSGANLVLKTVTTSTASWQTDSTGGGGATPVGAASELQVRDPVTAGVLAAASGVTGGSNYLSVGVTGSPTTSGVRIANSYAYASRTSGGSDVNLCRIDSSDNVFIGATANTASMNIDSSSGSSVNLRVAGSAKFFVSAAIASCSVPLGMATSQYIMQGSGTVAASGFVRLPNNTGTVLAARDAGNTNDQVIVATTSTGLLIGTTGSASAFSTILMLANTKIDLSINGVNALEIDSSFIYADRPRLGLGNVFADDGMVVLTPAASTITLIASQYSRKVIKFIGTYSATCTVTFPGAGDNDHTYEKCVWNAKATGNIVCTTGGGTTATVLPNTAGVNRVLLTPTGATLGI